MYSSQYRCQNRGAREQSGGTGAAPGLLAGDGIVVPPVGNVQLTLYRVSNKYSPDTHKSSDPTLPQYPPRVKTLSQVTILMTASEVSHKKSCVEVDT